MIRDTFIVNNCYDNNDCSTLLKYKKKSVTIYKRKNIKYTAVDTRYKNTEHYVR